MKQYVVIAKDGTDANALAHRMQVRPHHLTGASRLKANGNYVVGGATLNEAGQMDGSVMIVQFEDDAAFEQWYQNEPYIKEGVWQTIEVKPFKVANVE
ncbi:MAG TPA: YciI family protein [Phnomibacter sp.]|nr:YciI family protein [Phnomibacter sp.]